MNQVKEKKIGYRDIFRQKEYMKMIIAALINRFGDSIDAIASTWIVYELTGSAAWSAIIYAVNKVPTIAITPLAGAWVEGRNKKRIMIVTDIIRAICVGLVATGYLFGFLQPWVLILTNFTISTAESFRGPANTALTPKVLDRKYYDYGMSLMSTLSSIVELAGTAIAAGVIAFIGTSGAIYIDMVTFILSAVIICFANTNEQKLQKLKFERKEYFNTLKEGMVYAVGNKMLLFFVCVALFLNGIMVPYNSLQAPLATEILGGGAEVLSIMSIAITVSMLLGSMLYPTVCKKLGNKFILGFAGAMIGVFYLGLIFCQPFYGNKFVMYAIVAFLSAMLGIAVTFFNSYTNIQLMKVIDEEYLARVISLFGALCQLAIPIISFLISIVVKYFDTSSICIIAAVADIIFVILVLRNKALKQEPKTEEAEGIEQNSIPVAE